MKGRNEFLILNKWKLLKFEKILVSFCFCDERLKCPCSFLFRRSCSVLVEKGLKFVYEEREILISITVFLCVPNVQQDHKAF